MWRLIERTALGGSNMAWLAARRPHSHSRPSKATTEGTVGPPSMGMTSSAPVSVKRAMQLLVVPRSMP